jgi:signal transduction histidine kinase
VSFRKLIVRLLRAAWWFLYHAVALAIILLIGRELLIGLTSSRITTAYATFGVVGLIFAVRYRGPGWWRLTGLWFLELVISSAIMGAVIGSASRWTDSLRHLGGDRFAFAFVAVIGVLAAATLLNVRHLRRMAEQRARTLQSLVETAKREAAEADREKSAAQSELAALRLQVAPHFLWNTLAQLKYLIRKDPDVASDMVQDVVTYLRMHTATDTLTTLDDEFKAVTAYLNVMKIRMGERLTVSVGIPDNLREVRIAPFIIATLVENAIKHGVEPKAGNVSVEIRVLKKAGERKTVIEVIDDGMGLQPHPDTRGTGLGLKNVREQIRLLYGPAAKLTLTDGPNGGAISRLELPDEPLRVVSDHTMVPSN